MIIRRLKRDDIAAMRALNAVFAETFEDRRTYEGAPPDEAWLARLLGSDNFVALAACDGPRIVGGLCAYVLDKFEQARREIYIYDLAVAEAHRRRGVATALIERLRLIAREAGAWVIYVQADPVDPPAIALYSKLGVREDVLHFDIAPAPRES
ncbi:MAG: AAC(3)-I family aminoglycoside N-acetyltransferase [Methylobacteriaceae bacterium]|nr:AAC(3)-I family aminoglycoside N-acetyltransferase [Methylobacteriaceae bacterium]